MPTFTTYGPFTDAAGNSITIDSDSTGRWRVWGNADTVILHLKCNTLRLATAQADYIHISPGAIVDNVNIDAAIDDLRVNGYVENLYSNGNVETMHQDAKNNVRRINCMQGMTIHQYSYGNNASK